MALINDIDQVKSEPIEEGTIDVMNATMQQLIDEADVFLNRLQNRRNSTTNTSGSTLDNSSSVNLGTSSVQGNIESILSRPDEIISLTTSFDDTDVSRFTISNIRSNENLNNHQQIDLVGVTINEDSITIPVEATAESLPASPGIVDVNSNNSYDSDDTIIYSHHRPPTITVQSSPIVIVDDSFVPSPGQSMSTAIGRRRRNRTCRQSRGLENAVPNNSVVDLSNESETVLIISSDEEDNVRSTRRAAPAASRRTSIRVRDRLENNYSALLSVLTSGVDERHDVYVLGHNDRSNRRAVPATTVVRPVPAVEPVAKTPPKVTTTTTDSPPRSRVICPICYEPLTNRPATSTFCGHLFCTECLKRSQKHAKKCPVCKKPLTRSGQMHPVYLTTE
uniref:RING-type domain-containing protein n=1 Tax=Anopheles farauti TaxID=69004 RepID=A0A182Q0I5_9DIPT